MSYWTRNLAKDGDRRTRHRSRLISALFITSPIFVYVVLLNIFAHEMVYQFTQAEWSDPRLDIVTFDGADEVDPQLELIKGYGGALVREKITAASSRKLVILVGAEKLVAKLGERGKLPVEVVPFAADFRSERLRALGCEPSLRLEASGAPFRTDNGNPILDCAVGPIADPAALDAAILAIPGSVGTGLFVGMADAVVIDFGDRVEVRER